MYTDLEKLPHSQHPTGGLFIVRRIIISLTLLATCATLFVIALYFGGVTIFTSSQSHQGYQPTPDTRGTINIIWSCLSTIFLCIWVSLHFGVSGSSDTYRLLWQNMFFPELVVRQAVKEWGDARACVKWMREKGYEDFTMVHGFFVNMGGFKTGQSDDSVLHDMHDFVNWLATHDAAAQTLDFDSLQRDIKDRSKQDVLAKSLACLQGGRFLAQLLARWLRSMPVSELELTTGAYVMCLLVTYLFWWYKPYRVNEHVMLPIRGSGPSSLSSSSDSRPQSRAEGGGPANPTSFDRFMISRRRRIVALSFIGSTLCGLFFAVVHCTAWDAVFIYASGQLLWRICTVVLMTCPVIVCAAWAFTVWIRDVREWINPAKTSRIALPMSNPVTPTRDYGSTGGSVFLQYWSTMTMQEFKDHWPLYTIFYLCSFAYAAARINLLFLVVVSFWSQPTAVYDEIRWLSFVPQFS